MVQNVYKFHSIQGFQNVVKIQNKNRNAKNIYRNTRRCKEACYMKHMTICNQGKQDENTIFGNFDQFSPPSVICILSN